MDPDNPDNVADRPPVFNYVLSFLLVGVAWGFTTPFIRRAAKDFNAAQERSQGHGDGQEGGLSDDNNASGARREGENEGQQEEHELLLSDENEHEGGASDEDATVPTPAPAERSKKQTTSWIRNKIVSVFWTVVNLLRTPAYSVPLLLNLSGSLWFFLLVGKHGNVPRLAFYNGV